MPSRDETTDAVKTDAGLAALVDEELRSAILGTEFPDNLKDAIRYAVFSGGKRIRPILCFRSCEAVGGKADGAVVAAAALELVHCFSLVHDDLPAMDDDDLRRGQPTLHVHTNEAMAILAGDAMLTMAFRILSQGHPHFRDHDLATALTADLSRATALMISGQVHDTMGGFSDAADDAVRLRLTHAEKTGALIEAAMRMGAHCGSATSDFILELADFGHHLGLMFQAVDDLLDVTQPTEQVGKQTGKDAAAGKLTYPGLLGIDGTRAEIAKLLGQSLEALEPLGPRADPLRDMARRLAERTK